MLYIDDSGSMQFEENGERIDDLKLILSRVAYATSLFDEDGIQVRFMNSPDGGNNIRSEQQVNEMVSRTRFSGLTPMGRELDNKILRPLVLQAARSGQLRKPVLVITITDGQPTGESSGDVARIIKNASDELSRNPRYGKGALAFQFAQVGNDLKAREFLSKLDEEPTIGDIIDCTSSTFFIMPLLLHLQRSYANSMCFTSQITKSKPTKCHAQIHQSTSLQSCGSSNFFSVVSILPMMPRMKRAMPLDLLLDKVATAVDIPLRVATAVLLSRVATAVLPSKVVMAVLPSKVVMVALLLSRAAIVDHLLSKVVTVDLHNSREDMVRHLRPHGIKQVSSLSLDRQGQD